MTSAGKTKGIEIEVGLHQDSALSPLLFVIIIDVITEKRKERPGQCCSWTTWCCAILIER